MLPIATRFARLMALPLALAIVAPALAAQEPLTLARAIELAQGQGHQARAARATLEASRQRDDAFSARLLPQLSLGGTLPRYNRAIIPVVQPDGSTLFRPLDQTDASLTATVTQRLPTGGDLFVSSSLNTLSVSGDDPIRTWSSTPVSVGLRHDLFRPNTTGLDRREQPVRNELAERAFRQAREDIALQAASLFFDVYAARLALANATTNVAVNDTLYRLNTGRFEVGRIGENDLLQSELALLRARTSVDGARLEYDRARAALRLALGLPADAPLELAVTDAVPDYPVDTAQAVAEALRNGTGASEVQLREMQARRRVTEARLNNGFGATVEASVGFNATASQFDLAYRNLLEARHVALSVQVPLIQWGAASATIQAARADQQAEAARGEVELQQVAQEAHFAALQLSQARRLLILAAKADTVGAKRFEVAYNRYVIGRINMDNLYVAQAEKDQALTQYVQALRAYWVAHYRLRRVTLFDFETGQPLR
jgi:outer membrane protein